MERPQAPAPQGIPGIKSVISVGSGKGGVGKSTVAASVAVGLHRQGFKVGLMDADAYGPSIPLMLGVSGQPSVEEIDGKTRILPVDSDDGLKVMSIGFFIPDEQPAIWRGPMLDGLVRKFLYEVHWGELDYLIVDLPPTTGDVPLSLSQKIPMAGAVIVCTPQDVALLDAIRALNMFRQLRVPILGIVENMSQFTCPHCGNSSEIFGHGGAKIASEKQEIPFLGDIPIDLQARINCDQGRLTDNFSDESGVKSHLELICDNLLQQVEANQGPELPTLNL